MKEKSNKKFYILVTILVILCIGVILFVRFPLSKSNVAATGDTVKFTFSGTSDGADLKTILDEQNNNPKWNEGEVTIGDYQEPVQIEEAVIGHKAGEEIKDVEVTFPQDYYGSFNQLAGKTAKLNITIKEVDRCTNGNSCYPVNNAAIKEFKKADKEFNKNIKKLEKEKDKLSKAVEKNEDTSKINEKIEEIRSDISANFETMNREIEEIKIPTENETYKGILETNQAKYTEVSDAINQLNNSTTASEQA